MTPRATAGVWDVVRRWPWLAPLALCLPVLVSYLPAMLWGDFVWDDLMMIRHSCRARGDRLAPRYGSGAGGDQGGGALLAVGLFPVSGCSTSCGGSHPAGYHVVNVLLHLANTLLLWQLLQRLDGARQPGSWPRCSPLHPMHVESVAWVMELKDVLSGLFYLSAALAWIRFTARRRVHGPYLAALALYVAGLLAKSVVVTLPAALIIRQWWQRGRVTATRSLAGGAVLPAGSGDHGRGPGIQPFARSGRPRLLVA